MKKKLLLLRRVLQVVMFGLLAFTFVEGVVMRLQ
jgi:hypothetical protein